MTLTNVTNNVDITGICKIGGIISYGYGIMNLNNVVNTGDLTRTAGSVPPDDHYTRSDGVGGIIGFGHQEGGHMTYNFNGVKNTGIIVSDLSTYAQYAGQIAGKWSVMNATNAGDVVVLNSDDVPAAKACPTTGTTLISALPVYLGTLGEDGYVHMASALEDGKDYIYMASNISENGGSVVSGPAYILPNGATITVEHRFGTPNITDSSNNPITGELVSGKVYRYSA